jgi:hypothetical protein
VCAQYPFEKYPSVKYTKIPFKAVPAKNDSSRIAIAKYRHYRIELLEERLKDSSNILLYYNNKLIKRSIIDFDILVSALDEPLYVGDINGDGQPDFKVTFYNGAGSGLASSRVCRLYLFGKGHNQFQKIFFTDFYDLSNKERDFNNDKNYEIVGQRYLSYKSHAYWSFDIYSYKNGQLINVSQKYNYPIVTKAFTSKPSNQIIKKFTKAELKTFSLKLPEFYEQAN